MIWPQLFALNISRAGHPAMVFFANGSEPSGKR
jgi:hypothetical protein